MLITFIIKLIFFCIFATLVARCGSYLNQKILPFIYQAASLVFKRLFFLKMNILKKAHEIVYERKEEIERQYGDFHEGMERASQIASILCQKKISQSDMYYCMMALKLSRQSFNHKEDNLLDLVAYVSSLNDLLSND